MKLYAMFILLAFLLLISQAQAATIIPDSDEMVLLQVTPEITAFAQQHQAENRPSQTWKQVSEMMDAAQNLFQQYKINQAYWWINQNDKNSVEWLFLKARHEQYQHDFEAAKITLTEIFKSQPNHVPSHLMAARIARIQADQQQGQYHCKQTTGYIDLITTQLCLLDTLTYRHNVTQSVNDLTQLLTTQNMSDTQKTWAHQLLTEWYLYTNQPQKALHWLKQNHHEEKIYHLDMWMQIQWALNQDESILNYFEQFSEQKQSLPDGLLIKLAASEKRLLSAHSNIWQQTLEQRMDIRQKRNDLPDARAMTEYHLMVTGNSEMAQYWSQLNYESSQEWYDLKLMERAHE